MWKQIYKSIKKNIIDNAAKYIAYTIVAAIIWVSGFIIGGAKDIATLPIRVSALETSTQSITQLVQDDTTNKETQTQIKDHLVSIDDKLNNLTEVTNLILNLLKK